ncbi:MAG: 3D domain-containing protein [Tissierellia bacterium]|nr:3D domain-containing protein [Tissierellia bacterium]
MHRFNGFIQKTLGLSLSLVTIFSLVGPERAQAFSLRKARPITLVLGGQAQEVQVKNRKVEEILEELNIVLDEGDYTLPDLDQRLEEGEDLVVKRVDREKTTEVVPIPFEKIERENPQLYQGQSQLVQAGENGEIHEQTLHTYIDGEKRSSFVVSSTVVKEPVAEILEYGTKEPENLIHGKKYSKKILMKASAYDPSAGSWTASGTRARVGAVAVDPRVIPLGTKLYIESTDGFPTYGFATAEDTGGAIKGNRIDLFYNSNRQARQFGRRNVMVYILEDEGQ